MFCIVNIAKTEIIFLQQIQGLAYLIEDALSFNIPLYFQGANSHKQKGGVNEIIYLFNYEKQPSPKHVTTDTFTCVKHIICTIYYIEVIASLLTREVIFLLLGSLTLYFLNKAYNVRSMKGTSKHMFISKTCRQSNRIEWFFTTRLLHWDPWYSILDQQCWKEGTFVQTELPKTAARPDLRK